MDKEFTGTNDDELTLDEVRAIQALARLAKRWPPTSGSATTSPWCAGRRCSTPSPASPTTAGTGSYYVPVPEAFCWLCTATRPPERSRLICTVM